VSSFASGGDALYAGTTRGLARIEQDGSWHPVALAGPDGPLRITALAATPSHLWIGTAAGAWAVPWTGGGRELGRARWIPLVFGSPGASTDTITALAPVGDDVLAGTDDGGLVLLRAGGAVSAVRLWPARANDVNPGALASDGGRVAAGTQGAGLLLAAVIPGDPGKPALAVARPSGSERLAISAVIPARGGWLAGTDDGRVLEVRCLPAPRARFAADGAVPTM
jgi:ligand-binding sensor domain-containing protein